MLDTFQRTTVENIRRHKGKISLMLDDENHTAISTAFADERLNKDIAIALQGYFNRHGDATAWTHQNQGTFTTRVYLGEEDKADL